MRLLLEKNEKMENVLGNVSNIVDGKWFYIPGWFQKHENGDIEFHHINNLPENLTNRLTEIREAQEKAMKESIAEAPVTEEEVIEKPVPKRRRNSKNKK